MSEQSSPTNEKPTLPAPASEQEARLAPLLERQRRLNAKRAEALLVWAEAQKGTDS